METVKVKALDWDRFERGGNSYFANTILGRYSAWDCGGVNGHFLVPNGYAGTRVDGGLDEAKAAAQAHFEALILSTIESLSPLPQGTGRPDTMSGHTPGPWRAELARWAAGAPVVGFAIRSDYSVPNLPDGFPMHSISSANLSEHTSFVACFTAEEIEANAHLIAAAPDLLAALLAAKKAIIRTCDEDLIALYDAAIVKARPSTPDTVGEKP